MKTQRLRIDRPTRDPLALLRIRVSPPGSMLRYWYAADLYEALRKVRELQEQNDSGFAIIATSGKVLRVIKSQRLQWATVSKGGTP